MEANWERRVDELRRAIGVAFQAVAPPNAPAIDDLGDRAASWPHLGDAAAIWRDELLRLHWRDVRPGRYGHVAAAAGYLSPEAYRYHLPGLLLAALRGVYTLPALQPDMQAVARLGADARLRAQQALLDKGQRWAVGEFLALCLDVAQRPPSAAARSNPFVAGFGSDADRGTSRVVWALVWGWAETGHSAVGRARAIDAAWYDYRRPAWRDHRIAAAATAIEQAFEPLPRPGWQAYGLTSDGGDERQQNLFEMSRVDWRTVAPVVLARCRYWLGQLSDEALAYVLPGHLLADLEQLDAGDRPSLWFARCLVRVTERHLDEVTASLAPPGRTWTAEAIAPHLCALLTDEQRQAVAGYLLRLEAYNPDLGEAVEAACTAWWLAEKPAPAGRPPAAGQRLVASVEAGIESLRAELRPPPAEPVHVPAGLRDRIASAFAEMPRPTCGHYFRSGADIPAEMPREERRWRHAVGARPWDEAPAAFFAEFQTDVYFRFLEPEVQRHYLPALLLATADLGGPTDALAPSDSALVISGQDPSLTALIAGLSEPQRQVCCEVLELNLAAAVGDQDLNETDWRGNLIRAARPLWWGWRDVDHPAVQLAGDVYDRLHHFAWPAAQDAEVRALIAQVWSAFAETPPPPEGLIAPIERLDYESTEYAVELRGLDWRTAHPVLLNYCYAAPSFMSPEAFRYFLPAYLTADLMGDQGNCDPILELTNGLSDEHDVQELLGALAGPLTAGFDWRAHAEAKLASFSAAEREVIVAYLRRRAETDEFSRPDILGALESYWLPSLAGGVR